MPTARGRGGYRPQVGGKIPAEKGVNAWLELEIPTARNRGGGYRLRAVRKRSRRKNKLLHGRKEQDETENLRRYETLC